MKSAAIARNAPCPCGSGKRYKDCHGSIERPALGPATPDDLLRRARFALSGGQLGHAGALLDVAIGLAPERVDLLRERARVGWLRGDANAATTCRAALTRAPDDIAAWNLLGEILQASDAAAAERAWGEALRLDPQDPEALFHLGNRLRQRGEYTAAIGHYERGLARAPGHVGLHNNLGLALEACGQTARAETCYREALDAQPGHPDALANLAALLQRQQRYREAVALYARAVAVRRDFPAEFWISRGISLGETGALAEAETSFREAARLDPDHPQIHMDIGSVCVIQDKFDAAQVALARAAELDPGNGYVATMLAFSQMQCCVWDGLDRLFASVRESISNDTPHSRYHAVPLPLLAMPLGPGLQLAAARRWAQQIAARIAPERESTPPRPGPPGSRLRVGFVSSDFRDHPVAHLLIEYLERLDRSRIETFAYGLVPQDPSAFGQRVAHAFAHFVAVSGESGAEVSRRIHRDGIEVLIDLNGYTAHAKSEIFALRAAPVQVSWLGYLGTLGADWYDYVLTDRFVAPPSQQAFFTERLLYLPDCYCPSDTRRPVASLGADRAACGLPADGVVFCCFNNSYKILPPVFDIWMRLLAAVPGSVLWLSPGQATACANLRREASVRGVDPARLVFAPRVSLPEHLARHAHADLFLDTTPYNAGTTANDALFMGVPVLTCAGDTMASRVAGSQLNAIGLPELITTHLADYEALALTLGRDRTLLGQYRARLAANRHTAPLFDMPRFTRALDDLLLAAWENRPSPPHA
jgi:predicted O-linked N-acetylglucosamine transferase (SPINDLY family)